MSEYCLFQPGEYMDFEKEEVQLRRGCRPWTRMTRTPFLRS